MQDWKECDYWYRSRANAGGAEMQFGSNAARYAQYFTLRDGRSRQRTAADGKAAEDGEATALDWQADGLLLLKRYGTGAL